MRRAKLTVRPIAMPRDLKNPPLPIVFDRDLLSAGGVLYTVTYQNQGSRVEQRIRIKASFENDEITRVSLPESERMEISEGGAATSSFVALHIPEALPGERQMARIVVRNGAIPNVSFWAESMGFSDEVYILDLSYE